MKTRNNRAHLLLIVGLLIAIFPLNSLAHSGRTDWSGGHNDNRNRSGLGYYHYHCGGHPAHLHDENDICPYAPKDKINVSNLPKTMNIGDQVQLYWSVESYSGSDEITWSSSDDSVLSITESGLLKALQKGKATITAQMLNGVKNFSVIVNQVYIKKIELLGLPELLDIGQSIAISITLAPEDATYKKVTWESSDPEIIIVDEQGNVAALKQGNATITVKADDGSKTKTSKKVAVVRLSKEIAISGDNEVVSGKNLTLAAMIKPEDTSNKKVSWSSSDPKVASVSAKGVVTAKKVDSQHSVTITVKTTDGTNLEEQFIITVFPSVKSIRIVMQANDGTEELIGLKKMYATAGILALPLLFDIQPIDAQKKVEWSSSNNDIASVDIIGNLKTNSVGKASITASSLGGTKANVELEVIDPLTVKPYILDSETCLVLNNGEAIPLSLLVVSKAKNQLMKWTVVDGDSLEIDNEYLYARDQGKGYITTIAPNGIEMKILVVVTDNQSGIDE